MICEKEFLSPFEVSFSSRQLTSPKWATKRSVNRTILSHTIYATEKTMSRYTTMTLGFLLVFLGIKFHMVETYFLSSKATQFWMERIADPASTPAENGYNSINQIVDRYAPNQIRGQYNNNQPYNPYSNGSVGSSGFGSQNSSVFQSASYQTPYQPAPAMNQAAGANGFWPQKQISTPRWLGWPVLFLGAVFVLHGASMRRS